MFGPQTALYVVYALAAATAILLVEIAYLQFMARRRRREINRRLNVLATDAKPQEALRTLLTERGLTPGGDYLFGLLWLNRLYAQSGVTGRPLTFFGGFLAAGLVLAVVLKLFGAALPVVLLCLVIVAVAMPLLFLRRARGRRLRKFERQLPDALDMIVRSLKAGHPTSVAIALVGREMPDPVGTEFGIAADEVTFGAQLEVAVRKMAERVGFEGLQLLAVGLSIQARSGGNLAEILANLSRTLRARFIMRLKVRSLAAEGKLSAILMTGFPVAMFLILQVIAPTYYGAVWNNPLLLPSLGGFAVWALLGDFIMYRMVNFDF